jgi:hypothetical protein
MLTDLPRLRIAMAAIWLLMVGILYYELPAKFGAVSGCHARLAQLELIEAQTARNEAALDAREKALDAAEAQLNGIKP